MPSYYISFFFYELNSYKMLVCVVREGHGVLGLDGGRVAVGIHLLEVEADHGAGDDEAVHDVPDVSQVRSRVKNETEVENLEASKT